MRNRLLHSPPPDAPASFAGTLEDVIAGLAMMSFIIAAALWLGGLIG